MKTEDLLPSIKAHITDALSANSVIPRDDVNEVVESAMIGIGQNINALLGNYSALRDFALTIVRESAFEGCGLDGDDVESLAISHGIIEKVPYDPAKHGYCEFTDPGEDYNVFSEMITKDLYNENNPEPEPYRPS